MLELVQSNHGAEEFYSLEPQPHRAIEVRLDGRLVAFSAAFPVVYSGGINPLLWRPLAGPRQLVVAPEQLDLSALLPELCDGREHELSVAVPGAHAEG